MKKFYLHLLTGALTALSMLSASAQSPSPGVYASRHEAAPQQARPVSGRPAPLSSASSSHTDLYGIMLWNNQWATLDWWNYPYGVYGFSNDSFSPELKYAVEANAITAVLVDGYYYVVTRETDSSQYLSSIALIKYDAATGTAESTININEPRYSKLPLILTHNETSGLTYALTYTDDNKSHVLATYDLETGAMNTVGIIGTVDELPSFLTMSAGDSGKIYAIATDGNLYTIDSASAAVEQVGPTGVTPKYLQSAVYDVGTGSLWWAASLADNSAALYKVSTATGSAIKAGDFQYSEEFIGLYMNPVQEDSQAPAACIGLEFEPSTPGATTGVFAGELPSATVGGDKLSGEITVTVAVDGTVVKTFTSVPGEAFDVELSVEAGMRNFSVKASTAAHEGKSAGISVWVGLDVPAPVSNVRLSNENGEAHLSWDAPAGGQHSGYCPVDDIRYRITRKDGTIAAASLTDTSFSEKFPETIGDYSYIVTPFLEGGEEGIATESNTIQGGEYFTTPAYFDFNRDTDFYKYFTVIDNNGDNYTWQHNYTWDEKVGVAQYPTNWMQDADDYLVFPGIKLEKDQLYNLSFNHSDGYGYCTESIDILAGKGPVPEDLTITIADFTNIIEMPTTHQEIRFSVEESGVYYIAFYIHSPSGQSYFQIDDVNIESIGNTKAPAAVQFTATPGTDNGADYVNVSVEAPSKTLAGENLEEITAIEVYRGNNQLPAHTFDAPATGSTLEWTDNEPGSGAVEYRVVAKNAYGNGEWTRTEVFVGGILPPVEYTFDSKSELDYFTIINANGDDSTWKLEDGSMVYSYNLFEPADDWLISPNLRLSSERVYKIEATLRTNSYAENLAITLGAGTNPENHSILLDLTKFCSETATSRSQWIKVPEDGCYNIGFHAYSPKNLLRIYLDDFKITDVASSKAPDMPSGLTVTAAPGGELSATIAFTAPSEACNGEKLASLDAVEIYRGTETAPAKIFTGIEPGTQLSWTDTQVFQGHNTYHVVAANAEGTGLSATATGYIGHDTPEAAGNLRARGDATNANAILTWTAPENGSNGGYLDTESILYNIYGGTSIWSLSLIASNVKETKFEDKLDCTGPQSQRTYIVESCSDTGIGGRDTATVALGDLYPYPLAEMFENYLNSEWVNTILTNYNASWMVSNEQDGITSVDEGTGFLQFHKWADDENAALGILESPKVSMASSSNPWLTLSFYHNPQADSRKQIAVGYRVNDGDFVELATLTAKGDEEGWKEYSWPVEANASDFVSIVLKAQTFDDATRMFIDNISLDDHLAHNLTLASFAGPAEIGHEGASFTARVHNKGLENAESFNVVLVCNGNDVATQAGTALAAGENADFEFEVGAPSAPEAGGQRIYLARIDYTPDLKPADNISNEIPCTVLTSPFPGITTLSAEMAGGNVALTWQEPSTQWCTPVTDSFEEYTPFAIDNMGDWVLYDGDGQRTIGIRYGLSFTDWYTPKAWQVWDAMRAGLLGEDVAPRTGHLCLMSMKSDGSIPGVDEYTTAENDDWLISEEMQGGSDITFWLKQPVDYSGGNEAVEILFSSKGQDPADFELIETIELSGMARWNQYRVSLPDEAHYFAIRHHRSYFGLWLDDVTYSPLKSATTLAIDGYNIYRDDELIGTASTNNYVDNAPAAGKHVYAVAAKFDKGEGRISNKVEIEATPTAIDAIDGNGTTIATRQGEITVTTGTALPIEVYTPAGITIAKTSAAGFVSIPVQPGVYIVKAGATVQKTVVP